MLSTWCPCWPSSIRVVYTIQAVQGACVTRKRVENFEVVELSVCSRVVTKGIFNLLQWKMVHQRSVLQLTYRPVANSSNVEPSTVQLTSYALCIHAHCTWH